MDIHHLLKQSFSDWWSGQSVICFTTDTFPLLFFSFFLKQASSVFSLVHLDVHAQSERDIKAQLETAFLGKQQWYWLGSFDALPVKDRKKWLSYIQSYHGPNTILCVLTHDNVSTLQVACSCIVLPEKINKALFIALFRFFYHSLKPMDQRRIDDLFARNDSIDLDAACLLLQYLYVLGTKTKEFFAQWLDQLIVPQRSLFSLSQHFFSKERTFFLQAWRKQKEIYPEQFWISYWSDQIWRALFYCSYMKQKKVADAKKIGYRLPFRFLQRDYKRYSAHELQRAHQWLYDLDYALKNGGSAIGLDLFFYHFFLDVFNQTPSESPN